MEWTSLNDLREKFLAFFESKEHLRLGSFPLVPPADDKSLLLINSGMAPMKKWFLGQAVPPCPRVTTCQKCIRTPDIERVGITARHGTYFEMLGNFSFQDYFKTEIIEWAWEFLTDVLAIPADKLYISVYTDDDEAYDIWTKKMGIALDHMVRFGKEDNFWEHGSGPCGPCSEIYYDRGEAYGCGSPDCKVGCECDRFMEVWNLVFTQFDSDGKGTYTLLERPNIDTGMGLERLACVMQDVGNLFEVDTVRNIMKHVETITGKTYKDDAKEDISLRVITDHIRSTVFMVGDGVLPSNEGRGYVLRRLLRRAARHGRMLGVKHQFLADLCDTVIKENMRAYPELAEHKDYIKKVVSTEEERFSRTIDQGLSILTNLIDNIEEAAKTGKKRILDGVEAFKLNDTFGFPIDLTKEILAENNIEVDEETFREELQKQRMAAKEDHKKKAGSSWAADIFSELDAKETVFVGYEKLECDANVVALADEDGLQEAIATDDGVKENVAVVLDTTPFYAESGGQIGDMGYLTAEGVKLVVKDCKKTPKGFYVHTCNLESGTVLAGTKLVASVSKKIRKATERNHTSVHLLQQALREVLGSHVHQAGSYVDAQRSRFDFTHFGAMTSEEIAKVEKLVNEKIFEAITVEVSEKSIKDAKEMGATALFGEKYGDVVRVVDVKDFSIELCGGTHVTNTAQLGCYKILAEQSVAAGVRRIEATTGFGVLELLKEKEEIISNSCQALKVSTANDLPLRATSVAAEVKSLEKELADMKAKAAASQIDGLFENPVNVEGVNIFTAFFSGTGADALRTMGERVRDKAPKGVAVLCGTLDEKTTMVVAVGKEAQTQGLAAGALIKKIAPIAGGNGGGKPDFAMAGIKDKTKIDEALAAVTNIVKESIK